ncbi:MAG: hypothetical protein GC185_07595 [Alphaproteobacteria bacterium]|nr:hypothetical protein [Alphaproteobacteria bacterium]
MDLQEQRSLNRQFVKAAEEGRLEEMRALLAEGAKVNGLDRHGDTALIWAARREDAQMVLFLFSQNAETICCDDAGKTPLMIALEKGNETLARSMLAMDFNIAARDEKERTVAHYAAKADMALFLESLRRLPGGAEIMDAGDVNGDTPLMIAAAEDARKAARALLAAGVQKDAQNKKGQTALMNAAACNHAEMGTILVMTGADASLSNDRALDAKTLAHIHSAAETAKSIRRSVTDYAVDRLSRGSSREVKLMDKIRLKKHKP